MPRLAGLILRRRVPVLTAALSMFAAASVGVTARAQNVLPQGGTVLGPLGTVTGSQTATSMTITQNVQRSIINWTSFSVGPTNSVTFNQPNSSAAILNRVIGSTPSTIAGQINANGQVFLVNPNGISITPTGTVNVGGGFVASTLDIDNNNFMNGNLQFFKNGSSARVSNQGTINVTGNGGFVGLLGGAVTNTGTITVPLGKVGFGAGEQITLDPFGTGFMQVALPSSATTADGQPLINVAGTVSANGGRIEISAATVAKAVRDLVNVSGNLSATSLAGRDGAIVLGGGPGADVNVTGTLDVSGGPGNITVTGANVTLTGATLNAQSTQANGGTIFITATDNVTLTGATLNVQSTQANGGTIVTTAANTVTLTDAMLDASGATGGGKVRVGGGFDGGDTSIANATTTLVDQTSVIKSDALADGSGGTVVLWSENLTTFAGQISAKAGPQGGAGGKVQVSTNGVLHYSGTTDVTSPLGSLGTLLIALPNIEISDAANSGMTVATDPSTGLLTYTPTINRPVLNVGTLTAALAVSDVIVIAKYASMPQFGYITINTPITLAFRVILATEDSVTVTPSNLILRANQVIINQPVNANGGVLRAEAGFVFQSNLVTPTNHYQFDPGGGGSETTTIITGGTGGSDLISPMPSVTMGGSSGGGGGSVGGGFTIGGGYSLFASPASGASGNNRISYNVPQNTISNSGSSSNESSSNSGSCSGSAISQNLNKNGSAVIFGGKASGC